MNLLRPFHRAGRLGFAAALVSCGAGSPALDPVPVRPAGDPGYADVQRLFQGIPGIAVSPWGRLWEIGRAHV